MKNWDLIIDKLCAEPSIRAARSGEKVYNIILAWLSNKYNGRVSRGKIEMVSDNMAESVCLKLGLDY